MNRVPNTGHLDELVKECPVRRILSNFEIQENDVLMERVALLRELRGVSSYGALR